ADRATPSRVFHGQPWAVLQGVVSAQVLNRNSEIADLRILILTVNHAGDIVPRLGGSMKSLVFGLMIAVPLLAQEGHPLAGSWHGNWGTSPTSRTDFTVVMDWDGKVISGIINPGLNQVMMQSAKLNPKDWTVHFELDRKESSGTVHCMLDGKIDKLGSDR